MRGGRPRIDQEKRKSVAVAFHTSPEFRAMLDEAAAKHSHSLAKEIEFRLRRSFEVDDLLASFGRLTLDKSVHL